MDDLAALQRFAIAGLVGFSSGGGGPVVEVAGPAARAQVSLFGGQLLEWQPRGHAPVVWLSQGAVFDGVTAIRGGVPVCWPWFGGHPKQPAWPSHGFARNRPWTLTQAAELPDQQGVRLRLELPEDPRDAAFWPHKSRPSLTITVGRSLTLELSVTNIDSAPVTFGEALHSYFCVSNIAQVSVSGLEGAAFVDQLAPKASPEPPAGSPITFAEEVDRVYLGIDGPITITDPAAHRRLTLEHRGCDNAIVWNPWVEKSTRLKDIGSPDAYLGLLCVETANVAAAQVTLSPGDSHTLTTRFTITAAE